MGTGTRGGGRTVTVLLCGDVMLGRGIDQILRHPGDPALVEESLRDAREYVHLAEVASGTISRPVADSWPWGEALAEVAHSRPAVLVVNVETSITRAAAFARGKAVHYRMNPDNLPCLLAAGPDVCVLANNHVLDFGRSGLEDTLRTLEAAGVTTAGAGRDEREAFAPAIVETEGGTRVAVFGYCHPSSGVPRDWAAVGGRSGVALLPDLSDRTADEVGARAHEEKRRGSVVVVSLHWGSNWGFGVPEDQTRFARRLIEAGADIVHGHSSHHARPIEVYHGRLVAYGCGDFVNDYEGIGGYEEYHDELRVLYRLTVGPDGALAAADLLPFRSRRLRLERADPEQVDWLQSTLDRESRAYGVRVERVSEDRLGVLVTGPT
jgi:poly-gamma-glutamate synthesis protein (capsule biosynthesis protein)